MVDVVYVIVMCVVIFILRLMFYGVLVIMIKMIVMSDIDSILKLGMFVVVLYVVLIIMFIIYLLLLMFSGLNLIVYLKKVLFVFVFVFMLWLSVGVLLLNIKI